MIAISAAELFRDPVASLNRATLVARVGPWKLYPGLAKIEVSPEWVELFSVAKPPTTFPEYLRLLDPDDRERVAGETKRAFLMGEAGHWETTFQRSGRVILARAVASTPGRVIGVDIDITQARSR